MNGPRSFVSFAWLVLLASPVVVGCGENDGLPRQPVSGSVSFDGEPLATGSIQFQPDGSPGQGAVGAGAAISAGKYQIEKDKGLTPGAYKVVVLSHDASIKPVEEDVPGGGVRLAPELIPARYNTKSTLTVQVVADEEAVFNFVLEKR